MENKQIFTQGILFTKPHENAPDFIKGKLSFKVDEVIAFLKEHKSESGWVNCDLKKSREGKLYLTLNTFKGKKEDTSANDDGF